MPPKSVEVTIMGQPYSVKGDADEEYIRHLAGLVDGRMRELFKKNPSMTPIKAAIMTALNLADQLTQCEKSCDQVNRVLRDKVEALSNMLEI